MSEKQQTRRDFIKKATYVAPVILTLSVAPSLASAGSGYGAKGQRERRLGGIASKYGKKYELKRQEQRLKKAHKRAT